MIIMILWLFAKSIVCLAGYITPEQIHLSWTENSNEMRVTWVTFLPVSSSIYYREIFCREDSYWMSLESSYDRFDVGDYINRYEFIHTGIIHTDESCFYEYYVGSWMGWSKTYQFSGRTHNTDDFDPTNMILVADWGGGSQGVITKNVISDELRLRSIDAVLHAGDIAYDLSDLEGMVGDAWINMIQPIASNIPYMTLPGNHEIRSDYSGYLSKFKMPLNTQVKHSYSFDIGRAHYIMLNSEVFLDEGVGSLNLLNWLKEDLSIANKFRSLRPWIIMLTHRNLYCSFDWSQRDGLKNEDCTVSSKKLRAVLEDLLYENGVDLFMQAHVHNYERNQPIYRNNTIMSDYDDEFMHKNPNAPIYITNGNSGNTEGHNDPISSTPQEWSVYSSNDYGYGRLAIYNSTHLYYEQFSSNVFRIIDHVWIIKDRLRY